MSEASGAAFMMHQNASMDNTCTTADTRMSERRAELLLALTTVFWSGTFVFTKIALLDCDPVLFVVLRFVLASAVALALWFSTLRTLRSDVVRDGAILGFLYGAGFYLQTYGLQYTTISKSAFITGMVVLFVPGSDWLIRGVKPTRIHAMAVVVAGLGLLLLTHPEINNINVGDALTLGGSVLWSIYIAFLDKSSTAHQHHEHVSEQLVYVQFAVTTVLGLVAMATQWMMRPAVAGQTEVFTLPHWTFALVIALVYTALLGSLASTYLQTKVQRFVAPVKAGIIFTLEPIFASIIAYFSHGERLSLQELCGAGLMIGAIIFADLASTAFHERASALRSNEDEEKTL